MDFYLHLGRRPLIQVDDHSLVNLQWSRDDYLVMVSIDYLIVVKSLRTLAKFRMTVRPSTRVVDVIQVAHCHFNFNSSDAGSSCWATLIVDRQRFFSNDTMASLGVRRGAVVYCE